MELDLRSAGPIPTVFSRSPSELSSFSSLFAGSTFGSVVLTVVLAGVVGACDDDANNNVGTGEPDAGEICVPNSGDGRTQCGSNVCEAGESCSTSGLVQCLPGCLETLNCGPQQWCDLRASEPGERGLCRSINDPACGGGTGDTPVDPPDSDSNASDSNTDDGACPDVQGNYQVSLSSSSPDECEVAFSDGDDCSVSQEGCDITWGCDGPYAPFLVPGPIDSSGVYTTSGTYMGFSYTCDFEFHPSSSGSDLVWSCSVGQGGQAILCEGLGFL